MCSRFPERLLIAALALACPAWAGAGADELRVCADPNNLPFSNARLEGFENRLAALVAGELGRTVRYAWWPQRRGFVRSTLAAGRCDVVIGVPHRFELADTTDPYYRSTYVFVTRRDRALELDSFDDPRLRRLTIGVHAIGDDYANVPPAQSLAVRGLIGNVRGYSIYGAYSRPDPPRDLLDAVARGEIDVAIAWGPLAGYFAGRVDAPLTVRPVPAHDAKTGMPMTFGIAMAVRRGEHGLLAELEQVLGAQEEAIRRLLSAYAVPLVEERASEPRSRVAGAAP